MVGSGRADVAAVRVRGARCPQASREAREVVNEPATGGEMTERAAFHAERRSGIGASDAAAVLGVSPWKKPIDVWRDKLATVDPPEPESGPLRRGLDLEAMILERGIALLGGWYSEEGSFIRHPDHPFMIAHPDAVSGELVAVVDAKAMSRSRFRSLVEDGLDGDYIVQGQHLIEVARQSWPAVEKAIFLCFNWEDWEGPVALTVDRDPAVVADMIAVEREFWSHVEARIPPPPEFVSAPKVTSATQELPEDLVDIAREIEFQQGVDRVCARRVAELKEDLGSLLEDKAGRFERRVGPHLVRVTVSPVAGRKTFNHVALAARGPIDPWKLQQYLSAQEGPTTVSAARCVQKVDRLLREIREGCSLDLTEFLDQGDPYTTIRVSVTDAPEEEEDHAG